MSRTRCAPRVAAVLVAAASIAAACDDTDTARPGTSRTISTSTIDARDPVDGTPQDVLDPPSVAGTAAPDGGSEGDVADPVTSLRSDQPWRPAIHYAPPYGWMNDPNGLSYVDGRYHLFFQYNPLSIDFGDIGWGHAVSDDLVSWETWPVAIEPAPGELIFSGSLVADRAGTSPLCEPDQDPACLVAIYTTHRDRDGAIVQTQDIAVSDRGGIDFVKYDGNPVIDLDLADFRDPKVFWHDETQRWVMVVVLPLERQVVLFGSPDLVAWEELSRFGPIGAVDGIWECPDLFPVPVIDGPAGAPATKWVMKVDLNPGHIAGGSGGQYFLGEFDGTTFVADEPDAPSPRWVDWGPDFYCATTFHDGADEAGRPLWLGWMNNWTYAADLPTFPWRGSMTIPRRIELTEGEDGRLALTQRLTGELIDRLRQDGETAVSNGVEVTAPAFVLRVDPFADGDVADSGGSASVVLEDEVGAVVAEIQIDRSLRTVRVARLEETNAGPASFAGESPPAPLGDGSLTILADRSSVEVLADEGRTSITSLVLPIGDIEGIRLEGLAPDAVELLTIE